MATKSAQDKILAQLSLIAEARECELVISSSYHNTGILYVQYQDAFESLFSMNYSFNVGYLEATINVGGKKDRTFTVMYWNNEDMQSFFSYFQVLTDDQIAQRLGATV